MCISAILLPKIRFSFNYLTCSRKIMYFAKHLDNKKNMRLHKKISIFTLFVTICTISEGIAQKTVQRTLRWEQSEIANADEKTFRTVESFQGAIYNFLQKDMPIYTEKFDGSFTNVKIINPVYQVVKTESIKKLSNTLKESHEITIQNVLERKKEQTIISIVPFRKSRDGNVEKLISFSLEFTSGAAQRTNASRTYANASVLKDGQWFKMGIGSSGMYKLTYDDLSKMGIAVDQINPRNIRIYGNGGGILAESSTVARYDDLQESAIIIVGENDGVFNREDYILFYGYGPNNTSYDAVNKVLLNTTNPYSTESFYFLNFDIGIGKRMQNQASNTLAVTDIANDYNYFEVYEKNYSTGVNATIKSGRERYGEEFNNVTSYDFNFNIPNVITSKPLRVRADLLGRVQDPRTSYFDIKYNGNVVSRLNCPGVEFSYDAAYGAVVTTGFLTLTPSENININIEYSKPDITALGYLNFIWINAFRELRMISNQLNFRNLETLGPNRITQFNLIANNASNTSVLDLSNKLEPKLQEFSIAGNQLSFITSTDVVKEFFAFEGNNFPAPRFVSKIENQNLHALGQYDFIIITHPDFKSEAERLAEFRRTNNNLRTLVVIPDHIYNEFGSGAQDASAIRDFMKMFYDRAGTNESEMPKYLLLFGDGSYDNIGYVKPNTNYIVTFESRNSTAPFGSYVSDDFFGLLDDVEGNWDLTSFPTYGSTALDVAVGRLPVQTPLQAKQMVDKILHYSNPETFGDWRNKYVMIVDDQDFNLHILHSESHTNIINSRTKDFNIDKIYMDSYQQISTPAGNRFPEVNAAFNQRVNTGALVINYIGHGGENGLAHEKVLTIEDINSWKGYDNMPVLLTATCSFSRWDDPLFQSAGELSLLNPNGGAIAMYTTTRIVYANENKSINEAFLKSLFDSTNVGGTNTLGDIFRKSKNFNGLGLTINQRNFTLLGDPSLPFATPKYSVITDSINGKSVIETTDTLKALNIVTIKGHIADRNGNPLNNLNGVVYPTVYDKMTEQKTLGQDRESVVTSYNVRKNIIYKGKASVQNGKFRYTFVVPKDITYSVGKGRLSYYARLGDVDANGSNDSILVGGSSNNTVSDAEGPQMQVFLNDENFAPGGMTGDRPVLIVKMKDQNGVNTVGNGIGHNITATLTSGLKSQKIDLNEFYESTLDNYQEGEIRYPMQKLEPGNYKLTVKAWDVVNNSSEISTEFSVVESSKFNINRVYNYPNPFTTSTGFQFEHNRPGEQLKVMVQIFTVSGRLVKTIEQEMLASGSRISNILWDAKDDFGDKLGKGVYVYRLKVKAADGSVADKYQKLVLF